MSEVSSAPISIPSPVPEQVPDKMAAVRQAKKRKAQEDRDTLSDLKQKVSNLADSMSSKPEVVTKQKDEESSSMPSTLKGGVAYTIINRTSILHKGM